MKSNSRHRLQFLSAVSIALALMASRPVKAASISIDALNPTEPQVLFSFGQFEGGFIINGSLFFPTGSFTSGNGTLLNFTGLWIDLGLAVTFSRTVYWVDPSAPTTIHDIFHWVIQPSGASGLARISGFFQSEGGGTLPVGVDPADVIVMQPDGSHNPFEFSASFLLGNVLVENARPTPEPGTLALIGVGLAGLGFARRKRMT